MTSQTIIFLSAFILIAIAAQRVSFEFQKVGLPLITGMLLIGIIAGPFVLHMFPKGAHQNLDFINDIALAFIAFAAGSELYLKEIRNRIRQIAWITFGQLVVTFLLSASIVYFISNQIPFMSGLPQNTKLAISILMGVIFVARSPSSAIAIINEMRAKGPFTRTALGVTVIKDVLVIILFTITFAIGKSLVNGAEMGFGFVILLLIELVISFALGFVLSKLITFLLSKPINKKVKSLLLLVVGYLIYVLAHYVKIHSHSIIGVSFLIEPLIICIIAGFLVSNFSNYRFEFSSIIEDVGPFVYLAFFTLTGLSLSFDVLLSVWEIAVLLFFVRLISIVLGALIGGVIAGDSMKFNLLGWMPYITQAGVGLGLATIVAAEFQLWGEEFLTLVIAVIIISQIVGPPLFKWAIKLVNEDHTKADSKDGDDVRDAIVFGFENQSIALATQLKNQSWNVKIATQLSEEKTRTIEDVEIAHIAGLTKESFYTIECEKANTIVCLLSDEENYKICEIAYEYLGTKNVVVRLHDRNWIEKFHQLGVKIVEPNTAMVSLLDHFVRSPQATSLLLGMEENQDTIDVEITDDNIHGMALRNLRFPSDVTILSVHRKESALVCHGFTRLRKGDIVTVVGTLESLEKVSLKLGN
ncbi:MAG: potassium transporter TrkA [Lentimicrobiaceae bacterium]|nr:potassium transporter TrkA [Lentimicrobiaceae bacterium]MBT3454003.1 potassium transporter TrkA [Lentimicrobiaceae bacterium]MBT3819121.1 potassium transporter TrkA [Lentimicrobiaceae bacterium]MBT4060549.1 potassium transporter TrkA [Lentimicrobiaceae bacterium]MBT4189667.1 potassium transporter TrkA [Lentimicrobiaceae bacterium]